MSGTLSRDAVVRGLVAQGVPRAMAERHAANLDALEARSHGPADVARPALDAPTIEWPFRMVLPWSLLVSDNERKEPYVVQTADGPKARMRLTPRYAAASQKIAQLARGKIAGAAAAEIPLELFARVWIPGGQFRSDVANFGKGVHDALEKIVYRNDNLLYETRWRRVGIDVDAPRAELTITPLLP